MTLSNLSICLVIMILGFVFYEDLKFRGVQWWAFPVLFCLSTLNAWLTSKDLVFLSELITTYLFLSLLLITTGSVYFLVTKKNITKSLGIGDILFFVAIAPLFTTWDYLLFLSISFVLIAMFHVAIQFWIKSKTIPLAGYQSVLLIGVLSLRLFNCSGNSFFQLIQTSPA